MNKALPAIIALTFLFSSASFSDENNTDLKSRLMKAIQSDQKCDDVSASQLIKDLPPDEEILYEMIINECQTTGTILKEKKLSQLKVTLVAERILNHLNTEVFPVAEKDLKNGQPIEDLQSWKKVGFWIGAGLGMTQAGCKQNDPHACELLSSFKSADKKSQKFFGQDLAIRNKNRAEDDLSSICPIYFDMEFNTNLLKKEAAAGEISGFVDKERMHEYGVQIAASKKKLGKIQESYKKNSGHEFDYKNCPDKYNRWRGVPD